MNLSYSITHYDIENVEARQMKIDGRQKVRKIVI